MSREIKFRAIVPVNLDEPKRMEYFDLSKDDDLNRMTYADYDASQLMQFTGRRDVEGEDIYDGDILYVEFEKSRFLNIEDIYLKKITHVVKWEGQGWNIPNIEWEFRETLMTGIHNKDKPTPEWKKIGNIHQNPELVK